MRSHRIDWREDWTAAVRKQAVPAFAGPWAVAADDRISDDRAASRPGALAAPTAKRVHATGETNGAGGERLPAVTKIESAGPVAAVY